MCTHRRVTPALGARLLRSYVPLRYVPSESGCDSNTCLPADTLSVRKIGNFHIYVAFSFSICYPHFTDIDGVLTAVSSSPQGVSFSAGSISEHVPDNECSFSEFCNLLTQFKRSREVPCMEDGPPFFVIRKIKI